MSRSARPTFLSDTTMKRPLVLAALLAAGSFGTANATPIPNVTENLQLTVTNTGAFTTNANTSADSTQPSTVQYNSSQGQNNNFAVGANTSFGVSSSASSTPDYSVSTSAFLNSADTGTTLRNQIGTSGAAQAASSWASASGTYAQGYSNELVSTATETFKVAGGWEYKGQVYEDKAAFEFAYKNSNEYKTAYSEAFNSAYSNFSGQGSNSSSSAVGTISGSFESSTNGSTSLASGSSSNGSSSSTEAKTLYVADTTSESGYRVATSDDYRSGANVFAQNANTTAGVTTISYTAATASDVAASASASVAAAASQGSTNKVVVTGIGSDAVFQSSANTTFEVAVESNLGKVNANAVTSSGTTNGNTTTSDTAMGVTSTADEASKSALILLQGDGKISSSATANGSANGSFGTNSTASSNSASYTSVFFQAF